jgi:hypothetical protein
VKEIYENIFCSAERSKEVVKPIDKCTKSLAKTLSIPIIIIALIVLVSITSCGESGSVASELVGNWKGQWAGYLLGQHNEGNASMEVKSDASTTLTLSSVSYSTLEYYGFVKNNYFIVTSTIEKQSCEMVKTSSGFKVVLKWTGVNIKANLDL